MSGKKSCFSFSVLPPWYNFIFTSTIFIYQLINLINTGVFRTWNNQRSAVFCASQKSFPSNDIIYFLTVTHFFHSKHFIWKVLFFFQNCFLRIELNRPGLDKSVYVHFYVREKLVVVQKYYASYHTHEILIKCTSYFWFVTGYLLCFDQNKLTTSFTR